MKTEFLLDTVILIDHLNGVSQATEWLAQLKAGEACISVITRAEVLAGAKAEEEIQVRALLDEYTCLKIEAPIADLAASLRKKHKWKLPDAFQAALATENNLQLVTRNTKDFNKKDHPFVMVPYGIE